MKLMVNRRTADVRLTPNYGGQPLLASHLNRDPFNRPAGTGQFSSCLQALRAWLRSCCPSGTKYILPAEAFITLRQLGSSPCVADRRSAPAPSDSRPDSSASFRLRPPG